MKKDKKGIRLISETGITLIILVVTIVIMLLLASVTISLTIGENGLIISAREGTFKTEIAQIQEILAEKIKTESKKLGDQKPDITSKMSEIPETFEPSSKLVEKYDNKLYIQHDELVYSFEETTDQEKEWLQEIGIKEMSEIWDQTTISSSLTQENNIYLIQSCADFIYFEQQVNAGNETYVNGDFKLTKSLDFGAKWDANGVLTSSEATIWTPIGHETGESAVMFLGTFDGQSNTIQGIYVNNKPISGLFGIIQGATIKNLSLKNSYIKQNIEGKIAGGICAIAVPSQNDNDKNTIENCYNEAKIEGVLNTKLGGIVGLAAASTIIKDCTNVADISMIEEYNYDMTFDFSGNELYISEDYDHVGGIVGSIINESGNVLIVNNIDNCKNEGKITGICYVGGISGYAYTNTIKGIISNCVNTATIEGIYQVGGISGQTQEEIFNCYNTGKISGELIVGGIIGTSEYKISQCYNTGVVSNPKRLVPLLLIGGIAGKDEGIILECYNTGNITGKISVAATIGSVEFGGIGAGGISGASENSISDCYNEGEISAIDLIETENGNAGIACNSGGITGSINGTIQNSYNIGLVTAKGKTGISPTTLLIGGIAGTKDDEATVTNNYYLNTALLGLGDITPDETGTISITVSSDLTGGMLGNAWNQTTTKSNGYPKLSWQ